jgi:hypothetical protein
MNARRNGLIEKRAAGPDEPAEKTSSKTAQAPFSTAAAALAPFSAWAQMAEWTGPSSKAEALLASHLDALWELYVLTGKPGYLAEYIRLGGDLDPMHRIVRDLIAVALDDLPVRTEHLANRIRAGGKLGPTDGVARDLIASALEEIPVKPSRHKPDDMRDMSAFQKIEKWRAEKALKANDGRQPTLDEAWDYFGDQKGDIGYSGWRDRYNRGKKLLAPILLSKSANSSPNRKER